ncbi:precorrin-6A reductase [Ammonifex thiophilus]|uniref:Precorrin-6A reductase n=1 Tax=Ammonifex thiophilus TaxID=444093 RepID=A0A3D8P696_9THEO|nr:precorrin-6A reductase [Ammonifex thiophilus]RDV83626.1 precorrin-6A reductase [Ammonifex thiophilus]
MILVLGGTSEGREVAARLKAAGWSVLVSLATPVGEAFAGEVETVVGRRDVAGFLALFQEKKVRLVVDAAHPFATELRRQIRKACSLAGLPYLRLARPSPPLPEHPLLVLCPDFTSAAEEAVRRGPVLFLTTGTRTLPLFTTRAKMAGCRVVVRCLPDPEAVAACLAAGLSHRDIVALTGPFTEELNRALFRAYGATVVVTKESGFPGGVEEKLKAAWTLGLPVVLVRRPPEPEGAFYRLEDLLQAVEKLGKGEIG